jgi:hypothetical protein
MSVPMTFAKMNFEASNFHPSSVSGGFVVGTQWAILLKKKPGYYPSTTYSDPKKLHQTLQLKLVIFRK